MDSTRTLLFGIFVVARRRLTAPQVVALARPLGISPTNVRSHLSRMVADGSVLQSGRVRRAVYCPSPRQAKVVQDISSRLQSAPTESWDRSWVILGLRMPSNRGHREQLLAALWFDGFRLWAPYTFIRPVWPKRWALSKAQEYLTQSSGFCVRGKFVGAMPRSRIKAIYKLDSLDREALRLARMIRGARGPRGSAGLAFAMQLKVGGFVARLVGHAPRLPPALWRGHNGIRELIRTFRQFEERVQPLAKSFLDEIIRCSAAR